MKIQQGIKQPIKWKQTNLAKLIKKWSDMLDPNKVKL